MTQLNVEMAFEYGGTTYNTGVHICNDIDAIRFCQRCGYGKVVVSEAKSKAETPAPKEDAPVEVKDLPAISPGARKLIKANDLTDEQIAEITPTGKTGIIADDVEKYLGQ